jgi:hypothetical protein
MENILEICTILGGISAGWFLLDKAAIYQEGYLNSFRNNGEISLLSLPDDAFMFIDEISKINFKGNYQPTSALDLNLCKTLVNYGVFSKQSDSSYKPTREGKKLIKTTKNT